MCGIIHGYRRDKYPVGPAITKRYHKQSHRGKQGFGFLTIDDGKLSGIHRFEKEEAFIDALGQSKSSHILAHHRLPTSTPNIDAASHPIEVVSDLLPHNYYIVHNGVISNDLRLKEAHEKLGFNYSTEIETAEVVKTRLGERRTVKSKVFNDSEALAHELALFFSGKKESIETLGSVAFICVETDKDLTVTRIMFGRNERNPLTVEDNNALTFIRSEGGTSIKENVINYYSADMKPLYVKEVDIGIQYRKPEASGPSEDDFEDDVNTVFGVGSRSIGFRDNTSPTPLFKRDPAQPVLSPYVEQDKVAKLKSVFDSLPKLKYRNKSDDGLPVISADGMESSDAHSGVMEDANREAYEDYMVSDTRSYDLLEEIQSLEADIKDSEAILDRYKSRQTEDGYLPPAQEDDALYHLENVKECKEVLKKRIQEYEELDALLDRRDH